MNKVSSWSNGAQLVSVWICLLDSLQLDNTQKNRKIMQVHSIDWSPAFLIQSMKCNGEIKAVDEACARAKLEMEGKGTGNARKPESGGQ
jgi:hypothetical protein